jgi:RecJ-like exonuclease
MADEKKWTKRLFTAEPMDDIRIDKPRESTCPVCDGKGVVTMRCGHCGGSGKLYSGGVYSSGKPDWMLIL